MNPAVSGRASDAGGDGHVLVARPSDVTSTPTLAAAAPPGSRQACRLFLQEPAHYRADDPCLAPLSLVAVARYAACDVTVSTTMDSPLSRANGFDAERRLLQDTQGYLLSRTNRAAENSFPQAWDRFYATYNPLVRRVAQSCRVRGADLDDCAQEIWLEIIRNQPYTQLVEEFFAATVFAPGGEITYKGITVGVKRDNVIAERIETDGHGGWWLTVRARYSGYTRIAGKKVRVGAERVRVYYDDGQVKVDLGGFKGAVNTKSIKAWVKKNLPKKI
jgi:hypothetical protein